MSNDPKNFCGQEMRLSRRAKRSITISLFIALILLAVIVSGCETLTTTATDTPTTIAQTSNPSPTPVYATPTMQPTPTPTPTPDPEQQSIAQEGQDCAIRSYAPTYNPDHTQLAVLAASGVIGPQGNPLPWSTQENAVKAGKAITFCLQQYLWSTEPYLEKIEVVVMGQLKDNTGNISNILVGGSLTQNSAANFDWNQTPEQAWDRYDEQEINNNG